MWEAQPWRGWGQGVSSTGAGTGKIKAIQPDTYWLSSSISHLDCLYDIRNTVPRQPGAKCACWLCGNVDKIFFGRGGGGAVGVCWGRIPHGNIHEIHTVMANVVYTRPLPLWYLPWGNKHADGYIPLVMDWVNGVFGGLVRPIMARSQLQVSLHHQYRYTRKYNCPGVCICPRWRLFNSIPKAAPPFWGGGGVGGGDLSWTPPFQRARALRITYTVPLGSNP